jgi:hypothetical protein
MLTDQFVFMDDYLPMLIRFLITEHINKEILFGTLNLYQEDQLVGFVCIPELRGLGHLLER